MQNILLLAIAGAAGALCRYGLTGMVHRLGGSFPWGTFVCNILGTFLFGLIWTLAEERLIIAPQTRAIILTGFMGSFTTFSTFMFESGTLMQNSHYFLAAANIIGQCALGLLFLYFGLMAGKLI